MRYHIALAALYTISTAQQMPSQGFSAIANGPSPLGSTLDVSTNHSVGPSPADAAAIMEELSSHLRRDYLIALAGFVFTLLLYRLVVCVVEHIRTLASLKNDTQHYFAMPNNEWSRFKKHILYAPLLKSRHNRELRLSTAINMGTLPTRFQALLLSGILAANITLCVYGIPWHASVKDVLPVLRNRTGTLSVANLIPIIVLSSPKNPLIKILNISFDSMNIVHRNLARIAILEAVAHTVCWMIGTVQKSKS